MASYCVIKPRKRLTGWTLESGIIWSAPFTRGTVTAVYSNPGNTPLDEASDETLGDGDWFYDGALVYVNNTSDPNSLDYPGHTIEFPIYLSDQDYTAPSDPLDDTSPVVDWDGNLLEIPIVQNGSSESIYGFTPLTTGSVVIGNQSGFLNDLLYDCSFNIASCKAWVDDRKVFLGYTKDFSLSEDGTLRISCVDYNVFFDRQYNLNVATTPYYDYAEFPDLDPDSSDQPFIGVRWYKRRIFGMVDGHECVNISYNATPSTTANRTWAVGYWDGGAVGNLTEDLNHLAANDDTTTYFQNTPQVNVGDYVILNNNGTLYYREVISVDRVAKFITHDPIGGRTLAAPDTSTRLFIGRILLQESGGGGVYALRPGIDYAVYTDPVTSTMGFILTNDFEAAIGLTETPFDPSVQSLFVRVYGTKELDQYSDATDVGVLPDEGGVKSQAVSLLFRVIKDAGFSVSDIDKTTFSAIGADSHSLGFAIPAEAASQTGGTYKTVIDSILSSMLWTLSFYDDGSGELKLGLGANKPFGAVDYEADDSEHSGFDYNVTYGDVYSSIKLTYFNKETTVDLLGTETQIAIVPANVGADLHFVSKQYEVESLHYDDDEALSLANRIAYVLGDRRGTYKISLGKDYLNSTNLGVSYNLSREQMPGFELEIGTERTRQLAVIEVQKSSTGVSVLLDDQKGIEDNSGGW